MQMPYADYTYYTESYFGTKIPESEWNTWAKKASIRVNYLTFGRIEKLEASDLPDAVFDAVCSTAETMYEYDQRKQARAAATESGSIRSESNDGYSISFGGAEIGDELKDEACCDDAVVNSVGEYLAHTGLMFKGWSKKWDMGVMR